MMASQCLLSKLGDDGVFSVEKYLDVEDLLALSATCRLFYFRNSSAGNNQDAQMQDACYQRNLLWASLLRHRIPGYGPFSTVRDCGAKDKLLNYLRFERTTQSQRHLVCSNAADLILPNSLLTRWEKLGDFQIMKPRLLARCTYCPQSGLNFLFGGESVPDTVATPSSSSHQPNSGTFNDVWAIHCTEQDNSIKVFRVPIDERSDCPAYTCASGIVFLEDDLYLFGGLMDTQNRHVVEFSNQFYRLCGAGRHKSPFDESNGEKGPVAGYVSPSSQKLRWERLTPSPASISGSRSQQQVTQNFPPGRWGHTMNAVSRDMFILFGGSCPGQSYADIWVFTPMSGWRMIPTLNPIRGRGGHSAAIVGDSLYILGGNDAVVSFNEMWRISLPQIQKLYTKLCSQNIAANAQPSLFWGLPSWELVSRDHQRCNGPTASIGHSMTAVGRTLVVYGGRDKHSTSVQFSGGIYLFNTVTGCWKKFGTESPPHKTSSGK
jgi:hypothetical protein